MDVNDAGRMVQAAWERLPDQYSFVELDQYVLMPNHFHGLLLLRGDLLTQGDHKDRPSKAHGTKDGTIGRVIQAFKSITTVAYGTGVRQNGWCDFQGRLWQRNYYDHIIRDEDSLNRIRSYIATNPLRWALDPENPQQTGKDEFDRWLTAYEQRLKNAPKKM